MDTKQISKVFFFLFVTMVSLAAFSQGGAPDEVIADVNGTKITRSDLAKEENNKLLQAHYQAYLAEQQALDELIDNRLLAGEAKRQGISVEQLLDREVNSKIANPTEEQVKIYYDDLNSKESYETLHDKIVDQVRQRRVAKARAAYLQSLRTKSDILVTLAPPRADFEIGNAPRLGKADAPVRLVEFADYECPYCIKVQPALEKLVAEFGDQLSFYYKDMPMPMHSHAEKSAEAARCAGVQGKYWQYHDLLFTSTRLEVAQLKGYARDLKLDGDKFDKCLDSGSMASGVKGDFTEAQELGLTGTPSFFMNGLYFSGALEYQKLRELVLTQLKATTTSKTASARQAGN